LPGAHRGGLSYRIEPRSRLAETLISMSTGGLIGMYRMHETGEREVLRRETAPHLDTTGAIPGSTVLQPD